MDSVAVFDAEGCAVEGVGFGFQACLPWRGCSGWFPCFRGDEAPGVLGFLGSVVEHPIDSSDRVVGAESAVGAQESFDGGIRPSF